MYHQTTPLQPSLRLEAQQAAKRQDDMVMAIFNREQRPLTPRQVWEIGKQQGSDWELVSVRRSMTNLADEKVGSLVHWKRSTRMGPKGRPETLWALPALRLRGPSHEPANCGKVS